MFTKTVVENSKDESGQKRWRSICINEVESVSVEVHRKIHLMVPCAFASRDARSIDSTLGSCGGYETDG